MTQLDSIKEDIGVSINQKDIIQNKIMLADIRWLNGERSLCEKLVEAFRKVMAEYGK